MEIPFHFCAKHLKRPKASECLGTFTGTEEGVVEHIHAKMKQSIRETVSQPVRSVKELEECVGFSLEFEAYYCHNYVWTEVRLTDDVVASAFEDVPTVQTEETPTKIPYFLNLQPCWPDALADAKAGKNIGVFTGTEKEVRAFLGAKVSEQTTGHTEDGQLYSRSFKVLNPHFFHQGKWKHLYHLHDDDEEVYLQ